MLSKIKAIADIVWVDVKDTYSRCKIVLFAIGALILALEFQKLKDFLLVYFGQRQLKETEKADTDLALEENTANDEANALEQKAKQETTDNDWYKK